MPMEEKKKGMDSPPVCARPFIATNAAANKGGGGVGVGGGALRVCTMVSLVSSPGGGEFGG